MASTRAPWKRGNPNKKSERKTLTPSQKATAKRAAKKAGRPYPNLVDNMRAAGGGSAKKATRKTTKKATRKAAKKATRKATNEAARKATKKTAKKAPRARGKRGEGAKKSPG